MYQVFISTLKWLFFKITLTRIKAVTGKQFVGGGVAATFFFDNTFNDFICILLKKILIKGGKWVLRTSGPTVLSVLTRNGV